MLNPPAAIAPFLNASLSFKNSILPACVLSLRLLIAAWLVAIILLNSDISKPTPASLLLTSKKLFPKSNPNLLANLKLSPRSMAA